MSVVIGTAGHIDHGKTTLLRALTGIDADRLPEERRRGMTIDVGYAHLALPDGSVVDFVDVPGHDRLVGNMLVGAGEIDAVIVVVAADDGPNAQTLEHLELLDALGIADGLAVVTKADLAPGAGRRAALVADVRALLAGTSLAAAPVLVVSAATGEGIEGLRDAIAALAERVAVGPPLRAGIPRLAIDRVFTVRGRGTVVTGSLRGGRMTPGMSLTLVPGDLEVRIREVQVRDQAVASADGGRTALLLGGVEASVLRRGQVLTADPGVVATSRILVAFRPPTILRPPSARPHRASPATVPARAPLDRDRLRLHIGTDQAGALVVRGPRESIDLPNGSSLALLRLDGPIAAAPGDRFALRRPSPGSTAGGGMVLDAAPPRAVSRRRLTFDRVAVLAAAASGLAGRATASAAGAEAVAPDALAAARAELHGGLRVAAGWLLAADVEAALASAARQAVAAHHASEPASAGLPAPVLRHGLALAARRLISVSRVGADEVARQVTDALVVSGTLARDGDRLRDPARAAGLPPDTLAAMDRLEVALACAAPPPLAEAARAASCPPDGIRALEAAGRIVRLEDDLAWAATTYRDLVKRALAMAASAPLSPAAFRDATGTSRRFVLVILEDLGRRGLLRRTDAGHVLGPRTLARMRERAAAASGAAPAISETTPAASGPDA
jgi:selenocysteine-specific elongation factor